MQNITLEQQIPISKARANLAAVFQDLKKKKVCYVVRNYKPLGAVVDLEYLEELQRRADMFQMEMARKTMQEQFSEVLRKQGHNPDTVSEDVVKNCNGNRFFKGNC